MEMQECRRGSECFQSRVGKEKLETALTDNSFEELICKGEQRNSRVVFVGI